VYFTLVRKPLWLMQRKLKAETGEDTDAAHQLSQAHIALCQ
jgi:hypothetical protein